MHIVILLSKSLSTSLYFGEYSNKLHSKKINMQLIFSDICDLIKEMNSYGSFILHTLFSLNCLNTSTFALDFWIQASSVNNSKLYIIPIIKVPIICNWLGIQTLYSIMINLGCAYFQDLFSFHLYMIIFIIIYRYKFTWRFLKN